MTQTTTKRQEAIQERERSIIRLRALLDEETTIYTLTTYGRGETDWVRLFIAYGGGIEEITYYVAKAAELKQTDKGIAFGGAQYSKALEAADWAWRQAFGRSLDQTYWSEL